MAENRVSITVDVSEALTGLKGISREAKEAIRALKEMEVVAKNVSQPIFNGNATWNGESKKGINIEELLKDLQFLFDKHNIKSIECGEDIPPFEFQMGYMDYGFGLNGSIINLK